LTQGLFALSISAFDVLFLTELSTQTVTVVFG